MRFGEECPYITPRGWCSRKNTPCDNNPRKEVRLPRKKYLEPPPRPKQNKEAENAISK